MCWRVSTFHKRARTGRARPPMVTLTDGSGQTVDAYLKSPMLHSSKPTNCLEREWIATQFAQDLNLPCAKVVPVKVDTELIDMASKITSDQDMEADQHQPIAQLLESGPELLAGSVWLGAGWSEWTSADRIRRGQKKIAAEIYFFDTMIQNWDRSIGNPNLLINNNLYGMIDHEESFGEAVGTDAERGYLPKPWTEGGVRNDTGDFDGHPLWQGIKGDKGVSFDQIVKRCRFLPEARILGYSSDPVFTRWSRGEAEKICDYLLEAIDNINAIHEQIQANKKI